MRFARIAAFCAASVFAGTLAAPAFAQTPYDGNWQVTIVTKSGTCEPTASSMLTVADGSARDSRVMRRMRDYRSAAELNCTTAPRRPCRSGSGPMTTSPRRCRWSTRP